MSVRLSELVKRDLAVDPEIAAVTADSRKAGPGVLFAALPGTRADGRAFIPQALAAGAAAVLAAEDTPDLDGPAPLVRAHDPRRLYALAAAALAGAQPQVCVAVTGTNGKTSVATFCRQLFAALGHRAASMGTLGVQTSDGEALTPPGLTSPDAADVARLAADLAGRGVTRLALEASSHGLDQRRLDGLKIAAAGFTNLSQDHLDYHASMESYRAAKLELFERLLLRFAPAVLNADSPDYAAFAAAAVSRGQTVLSVGEAGQALRLVSRTSTPQGQTLVVDAGGGSREVRLPLAGGFQAANALGAAGLVIATGEDADAVLAACEGLEGAAGRLQRVGAGARGGEAYVDYAHTPDGVSTVLEALRPHTRGRLIVVLGAGGDRDRAKRPLMGAAAARGADLVIVTDDNPRSEDPAAIRAEVLAGAPGAREAADRRAAIRAAAAELADGDVLVVAGKGHEQGQTVAGVVHPFDDVGEVRAALAATGGRRPVAEPLWTSVAIAAATGGRPVGALFAATGVTFDTREVQPGDLFVALEGARDGHDFAGDAFARGAAGALVSRPVEGGPFVQVEGSTLVALEALAAAARERSAARRAAVTGSVGKTSVTQAMLAALRLAGEAHGSVKSFNNHIGVPLTLARMPAATERAVFEIGMNHADEITPLSRLVRPHVAVVTTVGAVHTENFADGEAGVARAKAEIFDGLAPGGVAIVPADGPWAAFLADMARRAGARVLTFGSAEGADARLLHFAPSGPSGPLPQGGNKDADAPPLGELSPEATEGATVEATLHGHPLRFPLAQRGAHWGPNSLAVLLACEALGVPLETTLQALAGFAPLAGRGAEQRLPIAGGDYLLIDESYNANPISMRAALDTLSRRPGRRIAVLTDMLELGPDGERMHAELAQAAVAADAARVFTAGALMRALHEALPPGRRGAWAATAAELAPAVVEAIRPGDVVMIKGSNGSKASLVVRALQDAHRPGNAA